MDIHACKMLREFHLDCWKFPHGLDPENFCSDFPHLETLLLGPCQTEKPIRILSSSLRKWTLSFPQEVIKKLYGRGDRTCCSSTHDKCWRHFLKHFEVKDEEEKIGQSVTLSSSKVKIVANGKKYKLTKLIFIFTWQFNS
ncbi:hypothetical protein H5410_017476 [Solanum commersonii]|uniref:Uncharacterized protein n=1 Tax=Solanum commersonii TaxID=4109 RepID=A0A9J6A0G3_SOLCO|nr:hypothetical protein H5410_017476 [Solanum commersonii]